MYNNKIKIFLDFMQLISLEHKFKRMPRLLTFMSSFISNSLVILIKIYEIF